MIRTGIVGMGGIGMTHARCYQNDELSELVAVCDLDTERAERAAQALGVPAVHSVKELVDFGIDAASVCTAGEENGSHHYEPTMQLLDAGVAVLGEKPISNRIYEAREMVEAAKRKDLPYAINLNHRFTPAALRAREWLGAGRLGELNMVNMKLWINNPNESSPHFHIRALHPHSLDVMQSFAGDVTKVHCFFKRGKGRQGWSNLQMNLLFDSGVIGHLVGSYDAGGTYGLETCELVGSDARVVIEDACEKLTFYPRFSREIESYECLGGMTGFPDTFPARIHAWLQDLTKGTTHHEVDGKAEDALKVQLVIEAAVTSWEEDRVVEVPEV